jgi:hypothetical protein
MAPKAKKHCEDLLDEALAESFPTSDPPEMTDPTVSMRARTRRGVKAQKPARKKAVRKSKRGKKKKK